MDLADLPDGSGENAGPIPDNKHRYKKDVADADYEILKKSKTQSSPSLDTQKENELKAAFAEINSCLIFDNRFYPKAASFIETNGLDTSYFHWLYKECRKRDNGKGSLRGFYYKLFFEADILALYQEHLKEIERKKPKTIICPVCGTGNLSTANNCSHCGLSSGDLHDEAEIEKAKRIYNLSPEDKAAYEKEHSEIMHEAFKDFRNFSYWNEKLKELDRRYNLIE